MCWTTQAVAPSACRARRWSSIRSTTRRLVRTRSMGCQRAVGERQDGLHAERARRSRPGPARSAPRAGRTRACPPRTRSPSPAVASRARSATSSTPAPPSAAAWAASTTIARPPAQLSESTTSMRHCVPSSVAACRADSTVPDRTAGQVDRDDVVSGRGERLIDLDEVADRRLRGRRQLRRRAQPLVERLEVGHLRLLGHHAALVDVEAHNMDAAARDEIAREVVR